MAKVSNRRGTYTGDFLESDVFSLAQLHDVLDAIDWTAGHRLSELIILEQS